MANVHYVGIDNGKITFSPKGTPIKEPQYRFEDEDEAAPIIARHLKETDDHFFMHSSACDFPDDWGRPQFELDEFSRKVMGYLNLYIEQRQ